MISRTKLKATGIDRVQLALDPLREEPAVWGETQAVLQAGGHHDRLGHVRLRRRGLLDARHDPRDRRNRARCDLGAKIWQTSAPPSGSPPRSGLELVTFHAGFVPHDPADPGFSKMVARLAAVAEIFAAADMTVGFGNRPGNGGRAGCVVRRARSAQCARQFRPRQHAVIRQGRSDRGGAPARPLDPASACQRRRCKAPLPGTWGEEVAVGTGQVDWPAFFAALAEVGFTGDMVIEREAGDQRVADIRIAQELVLKSIP